MHIASGRYEHREYSQPLGITETWEYLREDSGYVLNIVFQAQYTLNATVYFDADHNLTRFDYHIDDTLNGTYRVENKQLKVRRTLPNRTILEDTLVWSDTLVLDLPFLSCKSHTILHLNKYGIAPTFAPILRSGDRAGDLAKKSVQFIAEEEINLNGTIYRAKHFHYIRDYWLDEHSTILHLRDNEYEVSLVEYQR